MSSFTLSFHVVTFDLFSGRRLVDGHSSERWVHQSLAVPQVCLFSFGSGRDFLVLEKDQPVAQRSNTVRKDSVGPGMLLDILESPDGIFHARL